MDDSEKQSAHFSEFNEAKERFEKLNNSDQPSTSEHFPNGAYLESILQKLCSRDHSIDVGNDSTLFYNILMYSDYIQIKNEALQTFFTEIFNVFIFSDLVEDIVTNIHQLDLISHVKTYIVQGFLKSLQLAPLIVNGSLSLSFSPSDEWYNIKLENVSSIVICPSAFKIMFHRENFKLSYLNFLFNLVQVNKVKLNGCNLNGRDISNIFKGLNLHTLELSECGSCVNEIILKSSDELKNLTVLDVSKNPIFNETLTKIGAFPLESLNLSECIKHSGKSIRGVWLAEPFQIEGDGEMRKAKIDSLWEEGTLEDTIKCLNISGNSLSNDIIKKISRLNLNELDISSTLNFDNLDIDFPCGLKILKSRNNKFGFHHFKTLCQVPLHTLEMVYNSRNRFEDFPSIANSPLVSSLKCLAICIFEESEDFLAFLAKIDLETFSCELETDEWLLDPFFTYYPENRKYLKVLHLQGCDLHFTTEAARELNKISLRELSISSCHSSVKSFRILSCKGIHKSVVKLTLAGKEVRNEDLEEILKFKKLEDLSFYYSSTISEDNLKKVVTMKTLKNLTLEAKVAGLLNLTIARLLCIAPVRILNIYDDYSKSISVNAFKYLSREENLKMFSKNLVCLHLRGTLKTNMAKVLKNARWEKISIESCNDSRDTIKLLLNSDNLRFSLDFFKAMYSEIVWEDLANLNLSRLEVDEPFYQIPTTALTAIRAGYLLKFLRYLFLEDKHAHIGYLLNTSVSQINTY